MRRVLITGASGFIGSAIVPLMLEAGYDVHAATRHSDRAAPGVTAHTCDLTDPAAIRSLCENVRATDLMHLAWCTQRADYRRAEENLVWCAAGLWLLDAFRRNGGVRAVATGTFAEYGLQAGTLSEAQPALPEGMYATAKASLGALAVAYGEATGMPVCWARIPQAYGVGEAPHKFVRNITTRLLRGEVTPTTNGTQIRDFIHVRDLAAALALLLDNSIQGIVNLGSGQGLVIGEILSSIGELTGRSDLLRVGDVARAPNDPAVQVPNTSKLAGIGWSPNVPFSAGLAEEVAWCIDAGSPECLDTAAKGRPPR